MNKKGIQLILTQKFGASVWDIYEDATRFSVELEVDSDEKREAIVKEFQRTTYAEFASDCVLDILK